eukprot:6979296-Pyramimonas_sp.AAC.2
MYTEICSLHGHDFRLTLNACIDAEKNDISLEGAGGGIHWGVHRCSGAYVGAVFGTGWAKKNAFMF